MSEFLIFELNVGGGRLAISAMPGRTRQFSADMRRLLSWSPDLVLTLTSLAELECNGASSLGDDLAKAGIVWRFLPVADFGTPDEAFEAAWPDESFGALATLRRGGKVLVHCNGGCGRSGMVALRLMIAAGETPDLALHRLRQMRPSAIETDAQLSWAKLV